MSIGQWLFIFYQIIFVAVIFILIFHITKLKQRTCNLRRALFPFANTYIKIRNKEHWSGENTIFDYKTAYIEYCDRD